MSFLNLIAQAYFNTKLRELMGWRGEDAFAFKLSDEAARNILRSTLTFRVPVPSHWSAKP